MDRMKPSASDPIMRPPWGCFFVECHIQCHVGVNISVCSFAWWNNISAFWARLIVKHAIHMSTVNVVEYRSMSRSMSSANLKTGTLRITTMLSWIWSMSSATWWNQICHTTSRGWCRARCMIVLSNIAKSSRNCPKSRLWVRQCHVQSRRRVGKPATWWKRVSLYKTFWRVLSCGVIRFFTPPPEHDLMPGVRKSREKLWNTVKSAENASEFHN